MSQTQNIVCPNCDSINRIPATKDALQAYCGKCKQKLFQGHPTELDTNRFAKHIGRSGVPVLVDFWAPWCGPCKMMAPAFEKAAASLEPQVRLVKVNTEAEPKLAELLGIQSIPTLTLFSNGQELSRVAGALDHRSLVNWTQQQIAT